MKAFVVFSKFFSVGVIATLGQYGVLILLVELASILPAVASSIGYVVGAVINYWLNYQVTFKSTAKHSKAVLKFSAVASLGLLLNFALMTVLTNYLDIKYLIAQIISTLFVFGVNFVAHKKWTFSS